MEYPRVMSRLVSLAVVMGFLFHVLLTECKFPNANLSSLREPCMLILFSIRLFSSISSNAPPRENVLPTESFRSYRLPERDTAKLRDP